MDMALALGRRGLGQVWPNPAVGCVLVQGARVVGRGWTQISGRPHAERVALSQAGAAAAGATAYVTLEPCSHHGKTGPCADALIEAGVARVLCALEDPDDRVSGRGFARLREAGVAVDVGLGAQTARRDHAGFLSRVTQGRPQVTLKLASSLDGRIATGAGHSQWITGPDARRQVHVMRARHDAVMVGGGTARLDDPALTARGLGRVRQPVRVVLSRRLDLPLTGQLAKTAKDVPVWLCHGHEAAPDLVAAWQGLGAQTFACSAHAGHLNVGEVLQTLGAQGLTRVLCEGGGQLAASLLDADLVDQFVGFTAGLGIGAEGLPSIGALGLSTLDQAQRYALQDVRRLGGDVMHSWLRVARD